jgi:hypothetical protein
VGECAAISSTDNAITDFFNRRKEILNAQKP